MENLTQNQNQIISKIVSEFVKINEQTSKGNENIFAHLCEDVAEDKIRIAELNIINDSKLEAMKLQIEQDNKKYGDMLREIGLELLPHKDRDNEFQIRHQNGYYIGDGYSHGNALAWEYKAISDYDTILGKSYRRVKGHSIYFNGKKYDDLLSVFENPIFKNNLKIVLAK